MDKYIHDENNGLWYELQGDYYIPCLTIPEEEQRPIGVWGLRHLRYIRECRKGLYNSLLLSGKLNGYLADLNEQAENMFFRLVEQLAEKDGITETLKAENQMLWVQRMNAVRDTATEIVNNDLIYA
ncbi:MAG: TnpV protein [Christensenellales bacterium]